MAKILVIESEIKSRNIFLKYLKEKGFDTIGAENGLVGIDWAQKYLPDLVISNITMPKYDGYEVLATLRRNSVTATIPLIFVTNKATPSDFRKAMTLGANDYLIKPCTVEELLEAIATQLKKRNFFRQNYVAQLEEIPKLTEASGLELQVSLEQKITKTQKFSKISLDESVELVFAKSIFPSIPKLNGIFDFIEVHYHQPIGLPDLAQSFGYSSAHLTDLVRRKTGQSLYRWVNYRRMVAACSLLLKGDLSMDNISETVGYRNIWCFFRHFGNSFGMSPGKWRSEAREFVAKNYGDLA